MTRYRYYVAASLDGFIADEHDSLDWLLDQEQDDTPGAPGRYEDFIPSVGAVAMGATTYAWLGEHLRASGEAWPYEQPAFVFTHHSPAPLVEGLRLVSGDPGSHREALEAAAGDGDVWVVGGGALAAAFAAAGMLDEVLVSIAPVTLGSGRPLLPGALDLRLREVGRNGAFAVVTYDVAGPRSAVATQDRYQLGDERPGLRESESP